MKSMTCGGAPTVFSLKSRRSLLRRLPVGGWYGAISRTERRGVRLAGITNLHGARMRLKTFGARERGDGRRHFRQSRRRQGLDGDYFYKVGGRQAAAQAGGAA